MSEVLIVGEEKYFSFADEGLLDRGWTGTQGQRLQGRCPHDKNGWV